MLAANYMGVEFKDFFEQRVTYLCINSGSHAEQRQTANVLLLLFDSENTRHGPVLTQEPSDSIFPLSTDDKQVFINCKAKGNPPPHYR